MKIGYLVLAVVGFIIPNIFAAREAMDTGNVLLWLDPISTAKAMFVSNITTTFISDLLIVTAVFFIWTYKQALRHGLKHVWVVWVLTLLLGLGGAFPLFLYMKENVRNRKNKKETRPVFMSRKKSE